MWSLYWVILIVLVLFALYQIAVSRAVQMADEMIGRHRKMRFQSWSRYGT